MHELSIAMSILDVVEEEVARHPGARVEALDITYIYSITHLLEHGEERLIEAVERGTLPLTIAVEISTAADQDAQCALREAYETGGLRGKKLIRVKRLLAQRAKE